MKYGHFDDANREYVISTPKTPFPWMNYIGHRDMIGIISHTAGGYSFYKDARLRRLIRYRYNNIPMDVNGRYFYINDGEGIWSPTWKPIMRELDSFESRHGQGYTTITGSLRGLEARVNYFIPLEDDCEIHHLTLKNTGSSDKSFNLYSFLEFSHYNALDDMTNFQRNFSTAEVEVEGSAIYHKTEYRERRDHYTFYSVNSEISGFDTDRDTFVGLYNGLDMPVQAAAGTSGNSMADGWFPIASHRIDVTLKPGESKELVFVLGFVQNKEDEKWASPGIINKKKANDLISKYSSPEAAAAALNKIKKHYETLFSAYSIESDDEKLNRSVNTWNPYQCMITFNVSRSASGFESGIGRGIGFRDSNQDCMGAVSMIPDRVRERIIDLASTQFSDGSSYHQYQPLTKQGNADIGGGFNDDPLWLLFSTISYIKETGDYSILDEKVPFDDDKNPSITLLDHLKKSIEFTLNNRGSHGLPLIGRADWNDCLNLNAMSENPDESFQTCENRGSGKAESTFIAGMFVKTVPDYIEICSRIGRPEMAEGYKKAVEEMTEAVLGAGYDGEWFLRAYGNEGEKIGSHENEEGQIFIEPQGMCVLAGLGVETGQAKKALESVYKRLASDHGIKLLDPVYSEYHKELGEITSYPPGFKENGGVFTHNNSWVVIAEAVVGNGNRAFDYYKRVTPAYREEISDLHRMEPYVYPQMIAGVDSNRHGEAKNSWLTGTASWFYMAITQYIIGVHPDYDGITIKPSLPDEINKLTVKRRFRGTDYTIHIERTGSPSLKAEKSKVNGSTILYDPSITSDTVFCSI